MLYKVVSKNDDFYTVELVYDGVTYRSKMISAVDFVSLDNVADDDVWKLLTPLHFFSVEFFKMFGFE